MYIYFLEKSVIFCKSPEKFTERLQNHNDNFEFGPVQTCTHFVDLENVLQNESLVAKIGVDLADNEHSKMFNEMGSPKQELHPLFPLVYTKKSLRCSS